MITNELGLLEHPMGTTGAVAHEPARLTLNKLQELMKEFKRDNWLYVIPRPDALIPDDAQGILFVRESVKDRWMKK